MLRAMSAEVELKRTRAEMNEVRSERQEMSTTIARLSEQANEKAVLAAERVKLVSRLDKIRITILLLDGTYSIVSQRAERQ